MEIRHLVIFRELVRHMNFTRAAASLNYAQSNVTTQIRALEESLGTPLFERFGRKVELTEAGRRLLPYAEQILQLVDDARTEVMGADGVAGALMVGAAETVLAHRLPPVVQAFRERYPQVELRFQPSACDQLCDRVNQGEFHVAFVLEAPKRPSHLRVEPLVSEPLVLVVHPAHRWAAGPGITLDELATEALLLTDAGCSYRSVLEQAMRQAAVQPEQVVQFSSLEAIRQCALMGVGAAFLPQVAVEAELDQGRLAAVPLDGPDLSVTTHVAWRRDRERSPALAAFLQVTRSVLAS